MEAVDHLSRKIEQRSVHLLNPLLTLLGVDEASGAEPTLMLGNERPNNLVLSSLGEVLGIAIDGVREWVQTRPVYLQKYVSF